LPPQKHLDYRSNWGEENSASINNYNTNFIISHSLFCYNTEIDDMERSSMLMSLRNEKKNVGGAGVISEKQVLMRTPQLKPK